jgi:two-component system cell cycle response regulator
MTARVLLVGYGDNSLSTLERQLSDEFFDTLTASDADEALAIARRDAPDIILVDALQPTSAGFETCLRLKADGETAHIPVVMMTTIDQPAARVRGLAVGADDFLVRPVPDVELFARIRSLVRLKTLHDEIRAREATGGLIATTSALDIDAAEDRSTIVVVDDGNERVPDILALLRSCGTVVTIPTERAIDRLRKTPCDVIVLGLNSNRLDGLRLTSRLRSHVETRQLPILAFVEGEETTALVKGFELGISDCVRLPVDMLEMMARVRTLLRRKRLAERMRQNVLLSMRLATTDAVTGLYNRHYMTHHLQSLVSRSRAAGRALSLMLIDIDYFKRVNDTFGHAAGDRALRAVADRIASNVRGVDLSGRYGGEEFVVVMPETDLGSATIAAERLRAAIAETPANDIPVTVSIGVAELGPEDDGGDQLLARADQALYAAKGTGRNRVVVSPSRCDVVVLENERPPEGGRLEILPTN